MNEAIIKNFNESVGWEDRLYILGDIMMGQDIEAGCRLLGRLPGEKYIIRGNHDSDKKLSAMADVANVKVLGLAELYEYGKRKFYLSHYPTCTGNFSVTEKNGRKLFCVTAVLRSGMVSCGEKECLSHRDSFGEGRREIAKTAKIRSGLPYNISAYECLARGELAADRS